MTIFLAAVSKDNNLTRPCSIKYRNFDTENRIIVNVYYKINQSIVTLAMSGYLVAKNGCDLVTTGNYK